MPIFKFTCANCEHEFKALLAGWQTTPCEKCQKELYPNLPTTVSATTFETKDSYRGTQVKKGLDQQLKKRMNDHHDRYEIEEKIDRHGIDDAIRLGWTKKAKKV